MYHKRLIDSYLLAWKSDPYRKPLLLRGARQVGKSSAVRHLSQAYEDYFEINFEQSPQYSPIFSGELSPAYLIERLSVTAGRQIVPGKTLLFFDEIQACPAAISSLRFFYEQMPTLHLIAAGSLLEFALQTLPSYGVGRIKSYYMFPFSLDEFLSSIGEDLLLTEKQNASAEKPLPPLLHERLLQYLSVFMVTGGMPEAVARYAATRQLLSVKSVLDDLMAALRSDFAKYKKAVPSLRLQEVFNAVVQQAGGKFVYSKAGTQIKDYQAKEAVELLILAGWVIPVTHSDANGIPIGAEADPKKRKMMLLDTGIFQRILGLDFTTLYTQADFPFVNKGLLAEQFWGLEYIKYQSPEVYPNLYYWQREGKSNAEVDFLAQKGESIYPIEIKSSGKGQMQSLRVFLSEKKQTYGYRFSLENFAEYQDIKVFPLYAVFNFVRTL
jgi:uncharacterized protein